MAMEETRLYRRDNWLVLPWILLSKWKYRFKSISPFLVPLSPLIPLLLALSFDIENILRNMPQCLESIRSDFHWGTNLAAIWKPQSKTALLEFTISRATKSVHPTDSPSAALQIGQHPNGGSAIFLRLVFFLSFNTRAQFSGYRV